MTEAISVKDLHKSYGETAVLRGVSFTVRRGEVFGLLGRNGAGKTTTLETIVGLRRPDAGAVRVLGIDPAKDRSAITERMAVQPQAATLFPTLTVQETLELFRSFYRAPRATVDILHEVDLVDARRMRVRHLSGGQQRRLLIGIALVGDPEVLVLDEPSAGLDPGARLTLWGIIERQRGRGTTILLSTHQMDEATGVCDRLAILVAGRIAVEGEPQALIREHSSNATVSFTVKRPTTVDELRALAIPGVMSTVDSDTSTRVRVVTDDPDTVLRRLTFSPTISAEDFSVRHGSLEDLFLDVTHARPASETR